MSIPLTWGDLDLVEGDVPSTYAIKAVSRDDDSLDLGNPEPIEVALRSLLQDGSLVFSQGASNREVLIAVTVSGATGDALAQAETALMRQIGRPGVNLVWRGASEFAAPTVFEVVTSSLAYTYDDDREVALRRAYVIRLVCLPWVRSVDRVVSAAPSEPRENEGVPVEPVFVNIDDGTSLARWSSSFGTPNLRDSNTAVQRAGASQSDLIYTAPAPIDASDSPYLLVDYKILGSGVHSLTVRIDGVSANITSTRTSPIAGYIRVQVAAPPSFTKVQVYARFTSTSTALAVTNLARASFPPSVGTERQTFRRLPITGSARTQGSVRVEHDTTALGDVLVYTWNDDESGYLPPLSSYRPGTPTAVAGTVSGAADNLDTTVVFDVPAASLPTGDYLLIARMRSDTVGTHGVTCTARTLLGGTVLDDPTTTHNATTQATFTTANAWQIAPLGGLTLPTVRLGGRGAATVRITLTAATPETSNLTLDEAWLFNTTIGALTQVACGAGTPTVGGPARRLWLQPATVASDPTILCGDAPDASDAFYAGARIASVGTHDLVPESANVFTVTTDTPIATPADTTIEYYPRWHTHAVT